MTVSKRIADEDIWVVIVYILRILKSKINIAGRKSDNL